MVDGTADLLWLRRGEEKVDTAGDWSGCDFVVAAMRLARGFFEPHLFMKKPLCTLVSALCLHLGVSPVRAAVEISVDFFYDQLGDYGDWVEVGDYGYCWQPRDVDRDWRPYGDGQWAYTDAGWTWVSEEPYAWAVYHYGRWARLEDRGWFWVPGTEWGPAWVSWRRSPKYVGWAPLPPEASVRRGVGLSAWVDSYYDIGPSAYRFVEVRNFGAPHVRKVFVEPRENVTIINETTNITQITYVNNVIHNEGPRYEEISTVSVEPVRRLRLDRRVEVEGDAASFRGERLRSRVEGDALHVFAPSIEGRASAAPRRVAAKVEKVELNRGWRDVGSAEEVEKLRTKVRSQAKAPSELPPEPKFQKLTEPRAAAPATADGATPPARKNMPADRPGRTAKDAAENPTPTPPAGATPGARPPKTGVPETRPTEPNATPRGAAERNGKGRNRPDAPPVEDRPAPDAPRPQPPIPRDGKPERPAPPDRPEPDRRKGRDPSPDAAPVPRGERPDSQKPEMREPRGTRPDKKNEAAPAPERARPKAERPERPERPAPGADRPERPARAENPARPERPGPAPAGGDSPKERPGKGKAKDDKKDDDGGKEKK